MQVNTPAPTTTPTETFTGTVHLTTLGTGEQPSRVAAALVRFAPGARTHWHVHPLGQLLLVTDGTALVGTRDGRVVRARAGDTVVCAPGEEHWHGATADAVAAHVAVQESGEDGPVTWLEPVTDAVHADAAIRDEADTR